MGEGWGDFLATMIRLHNVNITDYDMGSWASGRKGGIRYYPYSRSLETNPSTYKVRFRFLLRTFQDDETDSSPFLPPSSSSPFLRSYIQFLDKSGYWGVHAIGEVWAEFLFTLAENLIDDHGFNPSLFPPPVNGTDTNGYYSEDHLAKSGKQVPKHGNTLAVQVRRYSSPFIPSFPSLISLLPSQLVIDGMKLQPCRPTFQNARDAILAADKALTGGENACTIWKSFSKRGLGPDSRVVGSTPWVRCALFIHLLRVELTFSRFALL
jgi:extracellular elastinolytic metalloproteinase